jgi:hypothetical protein
MNIMSYPEIRGEEVDHYMEVINHLSTQALTPDRATRFLSEITRET